MGVQAAQPGRQVISMSGDGGLTMLMGELLTLRQQHLPVKIVVFNNGSLGFIELEQAAVFGDITIEWVGDRGGADLAAIDVYDG